jgi:hypothetical protein
VGAEAALNENTSDLRLLPWTQYNKLGTFASCCVLPLYPLKHRGRVFSMASFARSRFVHLWCLKLLIDRIPGLKLLGPQSALLEFSSLPVKSNSTRCKIRLQYIKPNITLLNFTGQLVASPARPAPPLPHEVMFRAARMWRSPSRLQEV